MALGFGRKKAADDAAAISSPPIEAAPVPAHAPSSPPNDDLDAFDLESFADAPSLDTQPIHTPVHGAHADASGSAFDFPAVPDTQISASQTGASTADTPDFDKGYAIEQANAARIGHVAAPAPFVPPSATIQEPAAPFYEPQIIEPTVVAAPKKKFPLVPALGALAILGLGGGVAYMMSQGQPEEETAPAIVTTRPARAESAVGAADRPVEAVDKPVAPTNRQAPPLAIVPVKPVPVKAGAGTVTKVPKIVTITSGSPVRPGIAPASDQMTQLKTLWNRGANAKHRNDFAAARRYWSQGLKIQPGNVGFKESIAKLPK